jgi:hypothetical protein
MQKQQIFQTRVTKAAAIKQLRMAIKDLGMEVAISIGIEILKYPDGYRVVKNVNHSGSETVRPEMIFYTEDATERIHPTDLAIDFKLYTSERVEA